MNPFVDIGDSLLDIFQQRLTADFTFPEAHFKRFFALTILEMAQLLANYRDQMIGVAR